MTKGLRTWAEINLDFLSHNIREVRRITNKDSMIMASVKADAYGHGAAQASKVLLENGADRLAVACTNEAVQLRKAGILAPIIILGQESAYNILDIIEYNVIPTVTNLKFAQELSNTAVEKRQKIKCHIKIDSGMGRIGFLSKDITDVVDIFNLPNIEVEGIFTHFSTADDSDQSFTLKQFDIFNNVCKEIEKKGIHIPIKHACNSAGIIEYPQMHLDMVRPGIVLYGYYPSKYVSRDKINLKPVMTVKSCISYLKEVDEGFSISYGKKFITPENMKVATVAAGYGDGYTRLLSGKALVKVKEEIVPVLGTITMDQCMIDVTNVKDIKIDDEVILLGGNESEVTSIEQTAQKLGTISYEIICMLGKRVKRVYVSNEKIIDIK